VTQIKNGRGLLLKTYQALGCIEVGRTAMVVIVAFVMILIAAGCLPEKSVIVAAGDIAMATSPPAPVQVTMPPPSSSGASKAARFSP
jgi:hypothetical protein